MLTEDVKQLRADLAVVAAHVQELERNPQWARGVEFLVDKYATLPNGLRVAAALGSLYAAWFVHAHGVPGV